MKKNCILFILFTIVSHSMAYGQYAGTMAGLRTGYRGGLFFQMTGETGNAETGYLAMLGFNNNGIQLTGLKIIYETSLSEISPDLFLAWGYGGHAGFTITDNVKFLGDRYYFSSERFCPLIGIDAWGAAEYRFRAIPLIISINIKPFVELTWPSFFHIFPGDLGISVAYTF
jgi:hypothetical protein